jgi:hypothetical protein
MKKLIQVISLESSEIVESLNSRKSSCTVKLEELYIYIFFMNWSEAKMDDVSGWRLARRPWSRWVGVK